jgi:hypothetical protein
MIYIEGWVEKKTRQLFSTVWKKRYAVLSLQDGNSLFEYFEDESRTTLKGSISILSSSKIRVDEQHHSKKNNQIIVHVDKELSFKISLDSEESRSAWLSAFQRLLVDAFDQVDGSEEKSCTKSAYRTEQLAQEGEETLRELLVSTSLYRGGFVVDSECKDRIVCLDSADLSMYDLALTDKALLREARTAPRAADEPVLVMHLHALEAPAEVDYHQGGGGPMENTVDLRTPGATLRIMFRSASTASAWLSCLVELRNSALDRNKLNQASGLARLSTMIATENDLPEEVMYNIFDYDVKSNTHTDTDTDTDAELPDEATEKTLSIAPTCCFSAPPMHIAILVVGTRGDVQPFVYLGLELQRRGHTVRIGTHEEYRDLVGGEGLLFYPLGGDPRKLSSYMVKTKGRLIPDLTNCK